MGEKPIPDFVERFLEDATSVGLVVLDRAGRVLRANRHWQALVGRAPRDAEALSAYLVDFGAPFDLADALSRPGQAVMLNVQAAGDLPLTLYFRFYSAGDEVWAFAEHDPSEALSMGQSLLDANNELSSLSRQLHKTGAELERLNEAKNELLGMAAHDLRNPLGIISGMAKILERTAGDRLDERQLRLLDSIKGSSQFMLSLVDDILDVAKIEAGRLDLHLAPASLPLVVARAVDLNRIVAANKQITIALEPVELPALDLDVNKIEQVLNNLLANAINFSEAGTTITVTMTRGEAGAEISVADQGRGIPADELDRLFQPFHRTSTVASAGEKSTGLGLAIVQRIVNGHGGEVRVESRLGSGTTFFVTLPLPDVG